MSKRIATVDKSGLFLPVIVVDTREKESYTFRGWKCDEVDGGHVMTVRTERRTLKSGDYSLSGFETRVAVERKSLVDLFGTLGQGRDRFERELERLREYEFATVMVESTWPEILASPPARSRLPPKTVLRSVIAWQQRYPNVHWFTAGNRRAAEGITLRILERFWKEAQTKVTENINPSEATS